MTKIEIPPPGAAYEAVRFIYDKSPGRSWQRLNGALHDALSAAIIAHLPFGLEDFSLMRERMNGHYWMGNSEGSTCGERYYSMAVKCGHTPACLAFEYYAGRPAALWAEKVKTPERLCIGSEFTWEGLTARVTNMKEDYFVACIYGRDPHSSDGLKEGDFTYAGRGYRLVEAVKQTEPGGLLLRLGPKTEQPSSKPERIFKIKYSELAARRKAYDVARKTALAEIAGAETPQALSDIAARLSAAGRGTYRHFDIEDMREAVTARRKAFSDAANAAQRLIDDAKHDQERAAALERWIAGENVSGWFRQVRLRIKGGFVETSTGQSVTVEGALAALPVVLRYRYTGIDRGHTLDLHDIEALTDAGVKIGCTWIPWSEIDRIAPLLANV